MLPELLTLARATPSPRKGWLVEHYRLGAAYPLTGLVRWDVWCWHDDYHGAMFCARGSVRMMIEPNWPRLIAENDRYRRREPWDCKPGYCDYGEPQTNEFGRFIECSMCGWRVYAKDV